MSRRASLLAKSQPEKKRPRSVRFSDDLVFQDNVKENDMPALVTMFRRGSLKLDVNTINTAGLSALHQAVLDENMAAVKLLLDHSADINLLDEDTWTPLHAACANGFSAIARLLIQRGADTTIVNEDGERPIDLVDPTDFETISVMLQQMQTDQVIEEGEEPLNDEDDDDDEDNDDGDDRLPINDAILSAADSILPATEEDSTAEEDRGPINGDTREPIDASVEIGQIALAVVNGDAASQQGAIAERLCSKYLDSDDDNVEYVSDDDNVVLRRSRTSSDRDRRSNDDSYDSESNVECDKDSRTSQGSGEYRSDDYRSGGRCSGNSYDRSEGSGQDSCSNSDKQSNSREQSYERSDNGGHHNDRLRIHSDPGFIRSSYTVNQSDRSNESGLSHASNGTDASKDNNGDYTSRDYRSSRSASRESNDLKHAKPKEISHDSGDSLKDGYNSDKNSVFESNGSAKYDRSSPKNGSRDGLNVDRRYRVTSGDTDQESSGHMESSISYVGPRYGESGGSS